MKHNKCKLCGEPIILIPSAEERAKKYGKTAKYYRDIFTVHTKCQQKQWCK